MTDEYTCRSGKQCQAHTSDGPAVCARQDSLCPRCIDQIQRCLGELPTLKEALKLFLGGSYKTAYTSKVNCTPEPSAPMNVRVDALLGDIEDIVGRAGGYQVQIRDLVTRPAELFTVWDSSGEFEQRRYIDGPQRALDIRRVHARVSALVGLNKSWQRRIAPCWECALPTLGTWLGSGVIECTSCQCRKTTDEYNQYLSEIK